MLSVESIKLNNQLAFYTMMKRHNVIIRLFLNQNSFSIFDGTAEGAPSTIEHIVRETFTSSGCANQTYLFLKEVGSLLASEIAVDPDGQDVTLNGRTRGWQTTISLLIFHQTVLHYLQHIRLKENS